MTEGAAGAEGSPTRLLEQDAAKAGPSPAGYYPYATAAPAMEGGYYATGALPSGYPSPVGHSSSSGLVTPPPPAGYAGVPGDPMNRPYRMPSKTRERADWGRGGPVGSGVVPPDVEAQVLYAFADKAVRRGFMRKVFGIVFLQLCITVAFACVCMFVNPVKDYVQSNPWPFYTSWGLSFGLLLVISCNERLRRWYPGNMIFLFLFTLCFAFLVGMITSFFDISVVLLAAICTLVAVGTLTVIAMSGRIDVTSKGSMLAVFSLVLLTLVLVGIFWVNKIFYLVIAGVGALLTCAYIVYDLQLIMGGKQYAISPDEYIFAALSLYLDVVQLFIWLLYIIGIGKSMD